MNRRSYNSISEEWDAARSAFFPYESAFLDRFLRGLDPPARILDLGCGTGRPIAEHLLKLGFELTGVDQAENMLSLARQRFPEGRWIQAEMESFEPDEDYDGAVIWDSLFYVKREHFEPILRRVVRSLRPGARLMLTVGGSDHPAFKDSMFGQTFFYDSLPPAQTVSVLRGLGATIDHAEFINAPTKGRDKGRYGIVASVAKLPSSGT
ncbi:MAG: class I SAM-dependent methyltransferase [Pseudomonadota bacterium]